jgi:dTDP-4-dehydrorhamnose 3,5-epimerase
MGAGMTTAIEGLVVTPLREIADDRGAVLKLMRNDDPGFHRFGECYCSETLPGAVKAWKRHKMQTQNFAVPVGRLRLVVFDDRSGSPTKGALDILELGRPDNYVRVSIAPGLWYGFSAIGAEPALIVNCTDVPHDPVECERMEEDTSVIPYRWNEHGTCL